MASYLSLSYHGHTNTAFLPLNEHAESSWWNSISLSSSLPFRLFSPSGLLWERSLASLQSICSHFHLLVLNILFVLLLIVDDLDLWLNHLLGSVEKCLISLYNRKVISHWRVIAKPFINHLIYYPVSRTTSLFTKSTIYHVFPLLPPSVPNLGEEEVAIVVAGKHVVHQYRCPRPVFT